MASGKDLFKEPNTFTLKITGEMNGIKFVVSGRGNKPTNGHTVITCVCDSGDLPFSWVTLTTILGYGFEMFTKYPDDIVDFFKDCFPEGMTMDRTQKYHDGGVITSHHKYTYEQGHMHCDVTFKGEGFSADGDVMTKNILKLEPKYQYISPYGPNSIKDHFTCHFLTSDGRYVTASCSAIYKSSKPKQRLPTYHQIAVNCSHAKNEKITQDHTIQTEFLVAGKLNLDSYGLQ